MTAAHAPRPEPFVPATAFELRHPMRYVMSVAGTWRATCNCHYFWAVDPEQAAAAHARQARW